MKILLLFTLVALVGVFSVSDAFAESLFSLPIENPISGDTLFGFKTDMDGNYLLISSMTSNKIIDEFGNEVSKQTGKVFLFECNPMPNCTMIESFSHPKPQLDDGYGLSVTIDWPFIVIGAPDTGKDFNNNNRIDDDERTVGEVFVYNCASKSCKLIQTISAPTPEKDEYFGYSLALSGSKLVIGNWRETVDEKYGVGESYLYTCLDSGCTLRDTISNPTPEEQGYFGLGIDIDGDNLIIGANNAVVNNMEGAGMAYFYNCSSNICQLQDTIVNPFPNNQGQNQDRFGMRVSISGTNAAISAPFSSDLDEGIVYLYDCETSHCNLIETIKNPTPVTNSQLSNHESFGEMGLTILNNYLLVSDYHAAVDVDGSGKIEDDEEAIGEAYLYDCSENPCTLIETLRNSESSRGGSFGVSAAMSSQNRILIGAHGANIAYLFTDIESPVIDTTPKDTDVDGILDSVDSCPTQKETINGYQDTDGCPDVVPSIDIDESVTGMLSDGTKVSITASGEKMEISVDFEDSEHVNYDIMARQNGVILNDIDVHSHDGKGVHETTQLSSDPIEVTIIFQGYGVDDPKTGPIGEQIVLNIVPEFGSSDNENDIPPTTDDLPYEITIIPALGSGAPGCEETSQGCYIPKVASVANGGKVIFSNTDDAAHTFTAGTAAEGPSGKFDTSLVIAGSSYEWTPTTEGEFPYYCMVHPWMAGLILVGEGTYIPPTEDDFDLQIIIGDQVYDLLDTASMNLFIDGITNPQNVALEISGPSGTSIISRSFMVDSEGVSFEFRIDENFKTGTYKVVATTNNNGNTITDTAYFKVKSQYNSFKITSVQVTDQQGNPSTLQAGEMGFIKVNLDANKAITTLVTVNLFDSDLTSIGIGSIKTTLSSGNSEIILSFMIPSDVAFGSADIYVNAFSDWPSNGGIPLTGEISIMENIE